MKCFKEYPIEKTFSFNINAHEMLKEIIPPLGAEHMHSLFSKYGYTFSSPINEGWKWTTEDIPESDIWHMAALCNLYWRNKYEYWYNQSEFQKYKEYVNDSIAIDGRFAQTLNKLEQSEQTAREKRGGMYSIKDGKWEKDNDIK